jgi:hypothetical protein
MDAPVDATVRITPLSLFGSAVFGTTVLATPPALVLGWGMGWTGGVASATGALGGFVVLVLWAFAVGYRRHGRPVPTRARADGPALVIDVPRAWGTLFREKLRLEPRSVTRSDEGLTVSGPAEEWWDPGRYEVQVEPGAAAAIEAGLAAPTTRAPDTGAGP